MAVYSIIPDMDVHMADVRDTLNANGGSVGNSLGSFFTAAAKINRYAKYKPVRSTKSFDMTDDNYKEVDWGYRIPSPVNLSTYISGVGGTLPSEWAQPDGDSDILMNGWYYQRPTGTSVQPLRVGDFRKYNPASPYSLFGSVLVPTEINQNTTSMYVSLDAGTFKFSDFTSLSDKHIGVLIKGSSVQKYKSVLSSKSTDEQYIVEFNSTEIKNIFGTSYGDYTIYVFATATEGQNISSSLSYYQANLTDVYPLPVASGRLSYSYAGATSYFGFSITMGTIGEKEVTFTVTATNLTSTSRTINASTLQALISANNDDYEWTASGNSTISHSAVTVAANSTATVGTFTLSYAAYREMIAPWYVQVAIYYPNSEGTYVYAGSATGYYEGR